MLETVLNYAFKNVGKITIWGYRNGAYSPYLLSLGKDYFGYTHGYSRQNSCRIFPVFQIMKHYLVYILNDIKSHQAGDKPVTVVLIRKLNLCMHGCKNAIPGSPSTKQESH